MSYAEKVLEIAGRPEIWFDFDEDKPGGFNGNTGTTNDPLYVVATISTSVFQPLHTQSLEGLIGGSSGAVMKDIRTSSGGGGRNTFVMRDTSTFGVWVNTTSTATQTVWNVNTSSGSTSAGYVRLDIVNGVPQIRTQTSYVFADSGVNIRDGEWHFIVFRRTGGTTGELWVDGVLRATVSSTHLTENVNVVWWLGDNGFSVYGAYYDGLLTHAFHYPTQLTDEQIVSLYEAGMTPPAPFFRGWGLPAL